MSVDRGCAHPSNALLPWLVNGTLEGADEAGVREHLARCAACAREVRELSEFGRLLTDHAIATRRPASNRGGRRALWIPWALAAGLVLPALLGVRWALIGFPTGRDPAASAGSPLERAAMLDLGSGPMRGPFEPPAVEIGPDVESLTLSFLVPTATDPLVVEILDPMDRVVAGPEPVRYDHSSRATYSLPSRAVTSSGAYTLVLRLAASSPERAPYRFPFRVSPPAASD